MGTLDLQIGCRVAWDDGDRRDASGLMQQATDWLFLSAMHLTNIGLKREARGAFCSAPTKVNFPSVPKFARELSAKLLDHD